MKRNWLFVSLAVCVLMVALVKAQLSRDIVNEFLATDFGRAFLETYSALKTDYLTDVEDEVIIRGAINGMLEALDDPFTSYEDAQSAELDAETRSGSFGGIGATLSARNRKENSLVEIINVFRDSPAAKAGIRRGDIFKEVDGVNVEESDLSEIVSRVRGPEGTQVELKMLRPSESELIEFTFTVIRGEIEIVSVESTVLPQNVGYLSINTFSNERVHEQLVEQITSLERQGATSLILDLRNNGGGLLSQGILVADTFLKSGDIVFQRSRGVTRRLASADSDHSSLPLVVLVNENSASASEIVAGALQENGRALVIGEETFGKGVGQSVSRLADGGQLVLLNFEWLTPNRRSINKQGITPDIIVDDVLSNPLISVEGEGASEGMTIEFLVDGEVIGSATANEEGSFNFFQPFTRHDGSDIQGEAIVDLNSDPALQVAFDTLVNQVGTRVEDD
jgi:carboxyl-terminal processing protease|tara:strand:- start:918 stop:2273 length:1356 start_codon:yes stop_codon:yes gene_type:complete